jgi:hypothetical protein
MSNSVKLYDIVILAHGRPYHTDPGEEVLHLHLGEGELVDWLSPDPGQQGRWRLIYAEL